MKTHTRRLRSLNFGSAAHRRRVGEHQAGAARLGGASHALKTASCTLALVLALYSSLVHAQVPTCAAPGCNSVTSDPFPFLNTAIGTGTLVNLIMAPDGSTGAGNTAAGYFALNSNTTGVNNTAVGVNALQYNTTGTNNTAIGGDALILNTTGQYNTAFGVNALSYNNGNFNTASGLQALFRNTTGSNNTASGMFSLFNNGTGNDNTASGVNALWGNTAANSNTALGMNALYSNNGDFNTASGMNALYLNSTGIRNTATGYNALYDNTYGTDNTASGFQALNRNSGGHHNTADGLNAVFHNTTGNDNTGVGYLALFSNTTGLNNIALGANAGYAVTGSNNIVVGSTGSAGESGVIRIGGPSQSAAYVAGISSTQLTGSAVYVTANGQLGVLASSERYKTEIAPMASSTEKLHELRPVSFHLKSDPKGAVQYGLIAEEVNEVFPELVIHDNAGTIQGVRYDELTPMLLNEMQNQAVQISELRQQVAELNNLKLEMRAALVALKSKDQLIAQR